MAFCPKCGTTHSPTSSTYAVGRFNTDGPVGFMSTVVPEALMRPTREEAEQDGCDYFAAQRGPMCGCGHLALDHHGQSHGERQDSGCMGAGSETPDWCRCPLTTEDVRDQSKAQPTKSTRDNDLEQS